MILSLRLISGLIVSYLLGAFPTAYLFGRILKGIDIRNFGSGNVGATNAFRVLGRFAGCAVLIVDISKGALCVFFLPHWVGLPSEPIIYALFGIGAIIGHNWPIFLKFRGGKGIATSFGVLLGMAMRLSGIWPILDACLLVWIVIFFLLGYVSLASIAMGLCLPFFMLLFAPARELVYFGIILCLLITYRHKSNISRIISKKEPAHFGLLSHFKRK